MSKQIHRIRVDSLEPSSKYEGKWIAQISLDGAEFTQTFWMSHKQMGSIQKNLDRPLLFAAFDYEPPKGPRFIWASSDKAWLTKAFLEPKEEQLEAVKPVSFEEAQTHVASIKKTLTQPARDWREEDIPF